jgi:hypothetical protein
LYNKHYSSIHIIDLTRRFFTSVGHHVVLTTHLVCIVCKNVSSRSSSTFMAHIFSTSARLLCLRARINEEKEYNDLKNNIHSFSQPF